MRVRSACLAAALGTTLAAACGDLSGLSGGDESDAGAEAAPADTGVTPTGDAAGDGASEAAGDAADAADAAGDAVSDAGVLVFASDFENASNCGGFVARDAVLTRVSGGRSGGSACRVCKPSPALGAYFYLTAPSPGVVNASATYVVEAWVKDEPVDGGAPSKLAAAFIIDGNYKGGVEIDAPSSWTLVRYARGVLADEDVTMVVNGRTAANAAASCFLVDDVTLRRH